MLLYKSSIAKTKKKKKEGRENEGMRMGLISNAGPPTSNRKITLLLKNPQFYPPTEKRNTIKKETQKKPMQKVVARIDMLKSVQLPKPEPKMMSLNKHLTVRTS